MLTFLSTNQKPLSADVHVNIQDIRAYSRRQEVCREEAVSPLTEDKDVRCSTESEGLSPRLSLLRRSTINRKRYVRPENFEWVLHSCNPGPDNSWRTFLREAGHEHLEAVEKSESYTVGVAAAQEELAAAEKLQLLPSFEKRLAKEAQEQQEELGQDLISDEMMTTKEHLTNLTPETEFVHRYGEWINNFNPPVESRPLEPFKITTTVYYGDWSELNMHGYGSYVMALGSRYSGELKEGMYHGKGVLFYPRGSRIEGEWERGLLNPKTRKYFFWDGLQFKEFNWGYLRTPDHRFYSEIQHGLLPGCEFKISNSGIQHCIPIGWYDVVEGYYNPRFKAVMSYDTEELLLGDGTYKYIHKLMRITDRKELNWIVKHCRGEEDKVIGYQPHLFGHCLDTEPEGEMETASDEESLAFEDEVAPKEEAVSSEESITKEREILPKATILKSMHTSSPEKRNEQEVAEIVQMLVPSSVIREALVADKGARLLKPYAEDRTHPTDKLHDESSDVTSAVHAYF